MRSGGCCRLSPELPTALGVDARIWAWGFQDVAGGEASHCSSGGKPARCPEIFRLWDGWADRKVGFWLPGQRIVGRHAGYGEIPARGTKPWCI